MMVIKHISRPPKHVRDTIGARQDVLIWGYGVSVGHVNAVQVHQDGSADLVIEFAVPPQSFVPDDICARVGACRMDHRCPFVHDCALHECSDECGWCQGGA